MAKATQIFQDLFELAGNNVAEGGRPFACIITNPSGIVAKAVNTSHKNNDPTAHSEIECIRIASRKLGRADLSDCQIYAITFPCPMCLASICLAKISALHYATTLEEKDLAFASQYSTKEFYRELEQASASSGETNRIQFSNTAVLCHDEFARRGLQLLSDWADS